MDYEVVKQEFIKLKKEELDYIDSVAKISSTKILSEFEKIEIYRTLNKYEFKLNEILKEVRNELLEVKRLTIENLNEVIIEFDLDKDYLSSVNFYNEQQRKCWGKFGDQYREDLLERLGIDKVNFKFKLTGEDLRYNFLYRTIDSDLIQNNQSLIENPIYIFKGYYDYSEECCGPCFGDLDDYLYGIYGNILGEYQEEKIPKKNMEKFEKDKIIIHLKRYVSPNDCRKIFKEELLNSSNKTLDDCVIKTKHRVENLNYIKSPEYEEKILLDKINKLYKKVKGEYIKKEILYSGSFLEILKETYKLPNKKIVQKEKIVKNGGKDSVIVIALTKDKKYIITFQNRIKDKIIAEFPSGYIEFDEDKIDAAKRELKEETGYISEELFVVDEAYTSPGIDNSITYIVVAKDCIKAYEENNNGTELVNYGLFNKTELNYLIDNNIMNGAMNKLAYYTLKKSKRFKIN